MLCRTAENRVACLGPLIWLQSTEFYIKGIRCPEFFSKSHTFLSIGAEGGRSPGAGMGQAGTNPTKFSAPDKRAVKMSAKAIALACAIDQRAVLERAHSAARRLQMKGLVEEVRPVWNISYKLFEGCQVQVKEFSWSYRFEVPE